MLQGERFKDFPRDVKGNNELLSITRPDLIRDIHESYLAVGADLIETNTFGATSIAQADYGMSDLAREMNLASARIARAACDQFQTPEHPRFVAGALGPTPKTASISPDVNDPGARNVTFEELRAAYLEQTLALIEGGVDVLLVETVFDTLNAKAALFAIEEAFDATGERLPLIISGTVTDASGRILSGQTVTAFWYSVRHARPLAAGLLILAEQHMAAYFADDLQDHIYAAPVVAADPLRGHDIAPVFGSADDMRQLIMYGVQMGDQQHRHCALGIEEAFLFDCLIAKFLQVTGQIMLQFLLPHTENIIKSNHLAPPSAAVTEVLWQNALPMMRQMLQTLQAAHGSSDAR